MICLPGQILENKPAARLQQPAAHAQSQRVRANTEVRTVRTGMNLSIEVENEPYYRVIVLKGRLDLLTASKFANFIRRDIAAGARQVLIDCSALEQISSAGIGELVATGKALSALGGELAFAAPGGMVRKVFETVGFQRLYKMYESRDAARSDARWLSGWR